MNATDKFFLIRQFPKPRASGIRLKDYMETIKRLFVWFLGAKEKELNSPYFDFKILNSFYIRKENFKGKNIFINTLIALSKDINGFRIEFEQLKRDLVDNEPYFYFQKFFDYPIFRFDEDNFCVIDFKFLVEGICSGLVWKIDSIIKNHSLEGYSIQRIKEQYGYMVEEYFSFLMKSIFNEAKVTCEQNRMPDCTLEFEREGIKFLLIIEFTTKYYKISSLYNANAGNFKKDLNRILFSTKSNDKGKFINLDSYVKQQNSGGRKIVPILLTENYIGDFDLLNKTENFLDKQIDDNDLKALKRFKPIVLCLDDIESFWAISDSGKETEQFIDALIRWENVQKGLYIYNFSNFVAEGEFVKNENYANIFSFNKM